jgi:ABC-type polar amino acid transport system ATPase subunit
MTANPMAANSIVSISGLNKWYGDFHVLRDINLTVGRGERIVICGPSGSGKSTLIRCINALEEFQEGEIIVDGIELGPNLKRVDEVRREVANRVVFMDAGQIIESNAPQEFFAHPQHARSKLFLSQILR